MTAADYRAEARAWRSAARAIDADPYTSAFRVTNAMRMRNGAHWEATGKVRFPFLSWWRGHGRVLACLLLALECEDDARRTER